MSDGTLITYILDEATYSNVNLALLLMGFLYNAHKAWVVQKSGSAIHQINQYPVDKY